MLLERPIEDLCDYKFYIPSYQRGYRWSIQQVEDLLNDIDEFVARDEAWYCLQPVIVKLKEDKNRQHSFLEGLKNISAEENEVDALEKTKKLLNDYEESDDWELIDGQQRLTTIFLILRYLGLQAYSIRYQTRSEASASFLEKIATRLETYQLKKPLKNRKSIKEELDQLWRNFVLTEGRAYNNIDNFHLFQAFIIIKKFFEEERIGFEEKLLKYVKVIWYKTEGEDAIDVFTRINMGKIPLTNAELIKALFLNSSNFDQANVELLRLKQLEIATSWDQMEYTLGDEGFWYFINKEENNLPTRIEFIFDLLAGKKEAADEYYTFRYFNKLFKKHNNREVEANWQLITNCYKTLQEWYMDRECYHKIGYLVSLGIQSILDLYQIYQASLSKKLFKRKLNELIEDSLTFDLNDLEYGDRKVKHILLFHNIQTMLNNRNERSFFPFDRFKKEKWDIEHIHAIATEVNVKADDQKSWLQRNFIQSSSHQNKEKNKQIRSIVEDESTLDHAEFNLLIQYVLGYEDNNIRNLCLLDRGTNRSYKNDAFKAKRVKIIEREIEGTFIPICTKNVFMKYYSAEVKDLELWSEMDREAYLKDIQNCLNLLNLEDENS